MEIKNAIPPHLLEINVMHGIEVLARNIAVVLLLMHLLRTFDAWWPANFANTSLASLFVQYSVYAV